MMTIKIILILKQQCPATEDTATRKLTMYQGHHADFHLFSLSIHLGKHTAAILEKKQLTFML